MGIVQKDALRTTIVSYLGLILGYLNKVFLFILLLSTEEIGLLNLILSTGMLFAQFANLGTTNTAWKFFPFLRNEQNKHYGFLTLNVLIVLAGIAFFSLLLILFNDIISNYFAEKSSAFVRYYYWVIPTGAAIVLFKVLESHLRALYKNVFPVVANELLFRALITVLLLLYAADILTFEQLLMSICLGQFFPTLLLVIYMMRIGEWNFSLRSISIPRKFRQIIFNYSLYTYTNSLGAILIVSLDAIMITGMIGLSANGVYSTIIYLIRVLMIPYSSISRVAAPIVSEHWKNRNLKGLQELYQKVSSVTLVIGLYFFLLVWINRNELFSFLPKEFEIGIPIFLYLMIGRLLDTYFGLNGTILLTSKKYKYDLLFTSVLIVLVVALNLYFIPEWGVVGAAISTTIAYWIYNFARLFFVWASYRLHPFTKGQLYVLVLFFVVLYTFEWLRLDSGNLWGNLALKSILLTALFPVVIYLFRFEMEIVNYFDKLWAQMKSRLNRK